MRTAEQNADEFRALTRQGKDMRLAALVACSVEKNAGRTSGLRQGQETSRHRDPDNGEKISATAFAKRAGTSADRVLLHLASWNELADEQGSLLLPHGDTLTPDDVDTLNPSEEAVAAWEKVSFYPKGRAIQGHATTVAKALAEPEFAKKVLGLMPQGAVADLVEIIAKADDDTPRRPAHPTPLPAWTIADGLSKVLTSVDLLIRHAITEHPQGFGEFAPSHAEAVSRYIAELSAFRAWLLDPSTPIAEPTAEHFDIAEGPLFVSDILGSSR